MHKNTGHIVALKTYEKKNIQGDAQAKALHKEIFILAHLDHPNIMSLHEVIDSRTHVHLVMELCHGKSLYHLIKKARDQASPVLPEDQVRLIFAQIASAVAYMHSKNVAHRDLKLDNILINNYD
jgi:MAP/microtubule affinity-regulating kinase